MADITGIFKSTVKMLKVRHKELSLLKADNGNDLEPSGSRNVKLRSSSESQSRTTTSHSGRDEQFSKRTKAIVENITSLRIFLIKNRKAYMAASSNMPLAGGLTKLTEEERDKIDADAMSYIKLCNEILSKFKNEVIHVHLSAQQREHRMLVIGMVEEYLKVVCQLYSEQRAIRVKRAVDRQKMSRLVLPPTASLRSERSADSVQATTKMKQSNAQSIPVFDESLQDPGSTLEVTGEEAQLFKQENEQLYDEMNSTMEEVRQIEGKVVEISKLQAIFTDKVLEQDADISRIGDTMVHSTENVVQGNDDIREAMKNNAGMRVWIIFGICVLSFTLLFLDWYND